MSKIFLIKILEDFQKNFKAIWLLRSEFFKKSWIRSFPLMFLLFLEKNMNCINVDVLCNDIMDDYNTANNLVMEFPDQILFLRYETLTYHPYKTLDVLFDFLNLIPDPKLDEYLASR